MRPIFLAAASAGAAPLVLQSATWDGPVVNAGSVYGVLATVSGGVGPYTYRLLIDGVVNYSVTTGNLNGYVYGAASQSWSGKSVSVRVEDSAGGVVTSSSLGSLTVQYINSPSLTPSSTTPGVGMFISVTMSVSASPAPTTYSWSYQYKPAGGSWGAFTPFALNNAICYTGTFTTAGDQWIYYCTATNAAGSANASTPIITVQP